MANDRFAAVHWAGQAAHQLTVDLARRAHQSPGRLVDEDGLRGLPLAQRTGQGQSSVVAFLVWELARLQEINALPSTERGRLASYPSSPSLVSLSLFADKAVKADGVTHRSIGTFGYHVRVRAHVPYIHQESRVESCSLRHPSIHPEHMQ